MNADMLAEILNVILLGFLAITAIGIVWMRSLFAVVMLSGIYSLLSAMIFVVLDAVDVSFTEAAVGAGITTVLFLSTLTLTAREERAPKKRVHWGALLIVFVTGSGLVYATLDPAMPRFGDPKAPVQVRTSPEYLKDIVRQEGRDQPTKVGIPNVVTTVLASYRGYDTLGEVVVVFTAGIAVLLLLGRVPRRREDEAAPADKIDADKIDNDGPQKKTAAAPRPKPASNRANRKRAAGKKAAPGATGARKTAASGTAPPTSDVPASDVPAADIGTSEGGAKA